LLELLCRFNTGEIAGIEGFMNSGKSYLSNEVGASLSYIVLHTDDYITPGDESLPYIERLDYNKLQLSLNEALCSSTVVIEGICLRQILARINVAPALFVYVKRMSINGLWHDGFHLEDFEENQQSVVGEPERSDLLYHSEKRPHERANIIFERIEQPN
jgi:hypothetical protein